LRPDLAQIDAFTDRPFSGNPAGVCLLDRAPADEWMQQLATEMNLSETAFLFPPEAPPADALPMWRLRWFTPTTEVPLCGHATLAAAHHLFVHHKIDTPLLRFVTLSGELTAARLPDGWIELDFPADHPEPRDLPTGLGPALGLPGDAIVAVAEGRSLLVEVADPAFVEALQPDFHALRGVGGAGGVTVTSTGAGLFDIMSRHFAPHVGIDEDPVTGSAHTTLGPYWAPKLGKDEILARQASSRGGTIRVRVDGERVHLGGQAVTAFRARLADDALPPRPRRRRQVQPVDAAAN
jgi:PhzF family phenazine biosynthesis protein